jgi:hypothetical protein
MRQLSSIVSSTIFSRSHQVLPLYAGDLCRCLLKHPIYP